MYADSKHRIYESRSEARMGSTIIGLIKLLASINSLHRRVVIDFDNNNEVDDEVIERELNGLIEEFNSEKGIIYELKRCSTYGSKERLEKSLTNVLKKAIDSE